MIEDLDSISWGVVYRNGTLITSNEQPSFKKLPSKEQICNVFLIKDNKIWENLPIREGNYPTFFLRHLMDTGKPEYGLVCIAELEINTNIPKRVVYVMDNGYAIRTDKFLTEHAAFFAPDLT